MDVDKTNADNGVLRGGSMDSKFKLEFLYSSVRVTLASVNHIHPSDKLLIIIRKERTNEGGPGDMYSSS